ncbi:MAG: pseudouridine synthase [Flavobacteriia bacterium]
MVKPLEILYQDDCLIAINKPHGLLVHRSPIAADASEFAVQLLRNQIGQKVYPVHRLDRKTGGVLLFALNEEVNRAMQQAFMNKDVTKKYLAIVRGFAPEKGTIDYALTTEDGKVQDAITHYQTLRHFEIPVPFGKFDTSRYSFVEVNPETGRMHQIRKHFAHIFHPIIGDRPHGCNKQNKLFLEKWKMNTMLLHASELSFVHPVSQELMTIGASIQSDFERVIVILNNLNS